jgi:hypothetical protein
LRRLLADQDVTAIVDHCLGESAQLALQFVDELEAAYSFV